MFDADNNVIGTDGDGTDDATMTFTLTERGEKTSVTMSYDYEPKGGPLTAIYGPILDRLLRKGVIVRPMAGFGLPDHVRISVGLPEENERLVKTLKRLREGEA